MKRGWLLAAACLLLAVGFAALGVWQLERRAWKLDLIARVDARTHALPRPLPDRANWSRVNAKKHAYLRVRLEGEWLHDRETLVQAVTDLGPGWWVVTPLRTDSGPVLINRGFVPSHRRPLASRLQGAPAGRVAVTGLLRMTEPGGGFLRANDPAADRWYSRDVAAIARARKLSGTAPFFVDADRTPNPGGYPVGGLTVIRFRNSHLVYAVTWFGLSGLCVFGALMFVRERWADRGRDSP